MIQLPLPSDDMKYRSLDIRRPDTNAITQARENAGNDRMFQAAIDLVESGNTDVDASYLMDHIPWKSIEYALTEIFLLAGISTKLTDKALCPYCNSPNEFKRTKQEDNRIDVRNIPVTRFEGENYEDSFFVLRPLPKERCLKMAEEGTGFVRGDETDKEYNERLKYLRVVRYIREDKGLEFELKIKSITFRHAFARDMIRAWKESKGGSSFQRKLLYSLIAGMEYEYKGQSEPESWEDVFQKHRNDDGGILNFTDHIYSDMVIEGLSQYGRSIFYRPVCDECHEEWEQAYNWMNFFLLGIQQDSGRRILGSA